MCARYAYFGYKAIADDFGVVSIPSMEPRYNIAPSQLVPIIFNRDDNRQLHFYQWGFIPSWVKNGFEAKPQINARAEGIDEKPYFRTAFKRKRCLMPASGYYEWQGIKGYKQPYFITVQGRSTFAFAGLYDEWEGPEGILQTCTMITTEPGPKMREIHFRVPVILPRESEADWLSPGDADFSKLLPLLRPYEEEEMILTKVGTAVGNPRLEGPELILPSTATSLFDFK